MKKVLSGSVYDTSTAKMIGTWDNGRLPNDFDYLSETLYRTRAGKYFLHGEGGGNSRYGEWHGNSGGPGEKIMPMNATEAQEWAEGHLDADTVIEEFSIDQEGEERLNAIVSAQARRLLEIECSNTGKSMSALVEEAILQVYGEGN